MSFYGIQDCRACGHNGLNQVIDFGNQFVSDFVADSKSDGISAPLVLVRCEKCGLVQLKHTVDRKLLYKKYWYESGINESMVKALRDITIAVIDHAELSTGDWVLDIGSNDGTLLDQYPSSYNTVGIEPSDLALKSCHDGSESCRKHSIIQGFFEPNLPFIDGQFKAITAIAMFYDLERPNEFLQEVKRLLHKDGVFVIQMNDLLSMITNKTWDNIGHEHLEYYTFTTLRPLLEWNGLYPYHVEFNEVNGGSMRVYIRHFKGPESMRVRKSLEETLANEKFIDELRLQLYGIEIAESATKLTRFVDREIANGKRIYGLGASNRGNTILQYLGFGPEHIVAIADRNPSKHGLFTPTKIPIISEEQMRSDNPDYLFVLPYHFLEGIKEREKEYLAKGGKFIVPIPFPRVISKDGVEYL